MLLVSFFLDDQLHRDLSFFRRKWLQTFSVGEDMEITESVMPMDVDLDHR
jgi:hypothetical protein